MADTRAPDLETLLDFETAFETAIKTLLVDEDIDQVANRRGVAFLLSRRIDVEMALGQALPSRYAPRNLATGQTDARVCFERAWNVQFSLNVVTERDDSGQFHALFRAKARGLMLRYATLFTPELLPYHTLSDVRGAGTQCGLLTSKNEDFSRLTYAGVISIRPTAWPDPY